MKYLILFLLSASAFAADYSNAPMYPETKVASTAKYLVLLNGVAQPTTYTREDSAGLAATLLSQKCSCKVIVTGPVFTYETTWKKTSTSSAKSSSSVKSSSTSSKSSVRSSSVFSSSQVAIISFKRPTQWSNGDTLNPDQIKGYEVIKTPPGALSVILIPPSADSIEWRLPWQIADTDKVDIRTVLHGGETSVYANVPFVKNN